MEYRARDHKGAQENASNDLIDFYRTVPRNRVRSEARSAIVVARRFYSEDCRIAYNVGVDTLGRK